MIVGAWSPQPRRKSSRHTRLGGVNLMRVLRLSLLVIFGAVLAVGVLSAPAQAQEPQPPSTASAKVSYEPYVHIE
jgi:hypothetical protein